MVSMEEIIAIQKREKAAEKAATQKAVAQKQQSTKKVDQDSANVPAQSEKKGKEKGISIKEGASQAKQTIASKAAPVQEGWEKKGGGAY